MLQPARLAAALTLGGLGAPGLAAQSLADLCRAASEAKVGEWASFNTSGGQSAGGKLRFAIVGSERHGDSTLYWLEVAGTSTKDPGRNGIVQMLVAGPGTRATPVHAMIAKVGNQPAMKMPPQMVSMMSQTTQNNTALTFAHRCESAQIIGAETVTVPAGSFATVHVKSEGGDAWVSKAIPFAIVKAVGNDGTTLALAAFGADAKSSITEAPQEMPMPGMMKKP